MRERGDLLRDEEDRWVVGPGIEWEHLAGRVQAAVGETIARLPAPLRELLAVASVQGEEFVAEVVAGAQGEDTKAAIRLLSGMLSQRHRLVSARGVEWLGEQSLSRYRFRHFLFQSYLYKRLDPVERAHLHGATGRQLETLYEGQTATVAAELARHFEQAGQLAKAAQYLSQAGERANQLSAYRESIPLLRRGLALMEKLPPSAARDRQELDLLTPLGLAVMITQGYLAAELSPLHTRVRELCERRGDTAGLCSALIIVAGLCNARAEYREALRISEQCVSPILDTRDPVLAHVYHFQ